MVALLLGGALLAVLLPVWWGSGGRADRMRQGLDHAVRECKALYAAARTAADSAAAGAHVPSADGRPQPGDPPCSEYRRRRMLK